MKKAFRADLKELHPGDPVSPSKSFFAALAPEKRAVEKFLESHRPQHRPERDNAIFLFEDETMGRKWAAREKRNLYLVEVAEGDVLHRADWCWLQMIVEALEKRAPEVREFARAYWSGEATRCPVWELIVRSATVVQEVAIPTRERTVLRLQSFGQPLPEATSDAGHQST